MIPLSWKREQHISQKCFVTFYQVTRRHITELSDLQHSENLKVSFFSNYYPVRNNLKNLLFSKKQNFTALLTEKSLNFPAEISFWLEGTRLTKSTNAWPVTWITFSFFFSWHSPTVVATVVRESNYHSQFDAHFKSKQKQKPTKIILVTHQSTDFTGELLLIYIYIYTHTYIYTKY